MGIFKGVLAVLIPGAGKMRRRKYLGGAAVMVVWAALVECYVLVRTISPAGLPLYMEPLLLAAMISVWVANALLEGIHYVRERSNRAARRLDALYADALTAFATGEDAKADEFLRTALELDELNIDCLFLRAQVAIRMGRKRRARRLLRKCLNFDENGKWSWEATTALERL